MRDTLSRRRFLQATTTTAAFMAGPGWLPAEERTSDISQSLPAQACRFVHLTDIHVQPERRAVEGLVQCLNAVMRLDPQPEFIVTGGDLVMDVFEQDEQRARTLFPLLRKVFEEHTDLPVHHCIGNHDVFGWGSNGVDNTHPAYGKKMVLEYLELPDSYYRFDHKGWRFYILDDIQPAPDKAYQAYIDETQMAWLDQELQAKPPEMPAVVICHIPILTVTAFEDFAEGAYRVPTSLMCRDVLCLVELLAKHNVRLALSGHLHQQDRVEFRGVNFICDGAVSGGWWKGPHKGFEEGFGVLDLKADGSFDHRYVDYGWEATVE